MEKTHFKALSKIASQIIPLRDLDLLLEQVTRLAVELLEADRCLILWRDKPDETFHVRHVHPYEMTQVSEQLVRYSQSWVQRAVDERKPVLFERLEGQNDDMITNSIAELNIWNILCAPLILPQSDQIIGVLYVDSNISNRQFDDSDVDLIASFANLASVAIENARLFEQATIDHVTGAFMRGFLLKRLEEEFRRSIRTREPLTIFMVDLDNFKFVNDRYGHLKGDHVLRTFAQGVRDEIRPYDFIGRYGGDEFIIVMPGVSFQHASQRGDALRQNMKSRVKKETGVEVTISIGAVTYPIHKAESIDDLIRKADVALYRAKRLGKDMVYLYGQEEIQKYMKKLGLTASEIDNFHSEAFEHIPKLKQDPYEEHILVLLSELIHVSRKFNNRVESLHHLMEEEKFIKDASSFAFRELRQQVRTLRKEAQNTYRMLDRLAWDLNSRQIELLRAIKKSKDSLHPLRDPQNRSQKEGSKE